MLRRIPFVLAAVCVLAGCPKPPEGSGGPVPSGRCEVDLEALGVFSQVGNSARARIIEDPADLIGGEMAEGEVGDALLENDRIRVIISQPGRHFGPVPYGGWIVDADLQRPAGEPGQDQFGRMGVLYAFGRTIDAEKLEILDSGETGGAAVVAVTGRDTVNDFINVQSRLGDFLPSDVKLAIDANAPLPLKATTYYVLSPGESRVRVLTQLCNEGGEIVSIPVGDLIDEGGSIEFFNPSGCSGRMGADGCLIDPSTGFGFQGAGVAYGYRGRSFQNFTTPSQDAVLLVVGVVGVLSSAENSSGLLSWVDAQAAKRPGTFGMRGGESRGYLRDFYVTRDLAELTTAFLTEDGGSRGRLEVTLTDQDGTPVPGGRVAVTGGDNKVKTVLVADANGKAKADVAPGTWRLYAGLWGHAIEAPAEIQVGTNGTAKVDLKLGPSRTLTVKVADPFGAPMPAKVTVLCPTGTCPTPYQTYGRLFEIEKWPTDVAAIGFVPPSGTLALKVPPGAYEVVVTRGPEYNAWPQSWPASGEPVDLTAADKTVEATLVQVVDTTGWINADLHVHAVNSADSSVANDVRALSFLAEGVDVLVSTDHDVVTDFGPVVRALGAEGFMATMIGSELSTFDFGHFNAFPMVLRDERHGGPFDWAGGRGPTLRPTQIFAGLREAYPDAVIQLNHARGSLGSFTALQVDTDTLASHADPAAFRMEPAPDATAFDTRLLDANFDALEIANGLTASTALLNDWFVQLSAGRRKAATGVSDTHEAFQTLGGYSRTYVYVPGKDTPATFDPKAFAQALKALRAIGTNAPFLKVTAQKVDAQGMTVGGVVSLGETLSVDPGAGEKVALTVDVQTPEWIRFDTIEVFTHADGREALNGASNTEPPVPVDSVKLDPAALPIEAVPGTNGFNVNRVHVTHTFTLEPSADTWYVVIVRSSTAVGTLYPLAYDRVNCDGNLCTAAAGRAYAFSNAVFVDADGSGAYDTFPQKSMRGLRLFPPKQVHAVGTGRVPTVEELEAALRQALDRAH